MRAIFIHIAQVSASMEPENRKQQSLIFLKSAEEGKEMSECFLASYCGFPVWLSGKDPPAMQEA